MKPFPFRLTCLAITLACSSQSPAEVVTDGSMGSATALSGPNYAITTDLGQQRGSNLFHSFSTFNLSRGEQADFSGGNGIRTIIARVTGGAVSSIDGAINSDSANVWMVNPAGWMFGANAKINVNGSFHVSTADRVRFGNGQHFLADPAGESVLSISEPLGVSFLKPHQAQITLDQSILASPEKSTLSMVAGHVTMMNDAAIQVPGGQVLIGASRSAGDWDINAQGLQTSNTSEFGLVEISNQSDDPFRPDSINISDETGTVGGGRIQLLAGDTLLKNARLVAITQGDKEGGEIKLQHQGDLDLVSTAVLTGATPFSAGQAGAIEVSANNLTMIENSSISSSVEPFSTGRAGNIDITMSDTLSMDGRGTDIFSNTSGQGAGGTIKIHTAGIEMFDNASIRSVTAAEGTAGDITVISKQINMQDGATIDSSASVLGEDVAKGGSGGELTIRTDRLSLSGSGTLITSSSFDNGQQGGDIRIETKGISLTDEAEIRAIRDKPNLMGEANSQASAGNIEIINSGQLQIDNSAKITTQAVDGNGGKITLNSQDLILTNALVTTSVEGSKGSGGDINVDSDLLVMDTGFIQANTSAQSASGGDIVINANQFIVSGGQVAVGGLVRQSFTAGSGLNVIQAAAPDGDPGQVDVSNVELNIAGQLSPLQSSFSAKQNISDNPCKVARGQTLSSLVVAGQGGLPSNASEDVMLPVPVIESETGNQTMSPSQTNKKTIKHTIQCPQDKE